MVTLTLFFIGATPMITTDSLPICNLSTLIDAEIETTYFPGSNIKTLILNASGKTSRGSNNNHAPSFINSNLSSFLSSSFPLVSNSDSHSTPAKSKHFRILNNWLFVDKCLLPPTTTAPVEIAKTSKIPKIQDA